MHADRRHLPRCPDEPALVAPQELHRWLGAIPLDDRRTWFCVWAPERDIVEWESADHPSQRVPMRKTAAGYHVTVIDDAPAGTRYAYRLDGGPARPDPASRFQPDGVHGPSQVVSRSFPWTDDAWQGIPREALVIYELHVGAFTEAGTFESLIERLDELIDLGITAIELMPVAAAPGRWNWGYDGVDWFAPQRTYGTPDDFRRLVDAAHARGLAVILDVVYNHLGPEGNYLGEYGAYLSDHHQTVWGDAPNFDGSEHARELRRFVVANALYWYEEFHLDGLRIDAIHCMEDDGEPHIVRELGEAVRRWSDDCGRRNGVLLIAESNIYDPEMLMPLEEGGLGFDAEWCDDFLHGLFAVIRPHEQLSNRVYRPGQDLAQTLHSGFVFEGSLRRPRQRRENRARVDTEGLIYSIQNHDFIGNHPQGKRLHQLASPDVQRSAASLLILMPAIPMLFMGEEFASEQPFQFFVDFGNEQLRKAVVKGRQAEYPQHDWSNGVSPVSERAFESSRIGGRDEGDAAMWDWYRQLIQLRSQWRNSGLLADRNICVETDIERGLYVVGYNRDDERSVVAVRLSAVGSKAEPMRCELENPMLAKMITAKWLQADSQAGVSGPETNDPEVLLPNHAKVFYQRH